MGMEIWEKSTTGWNVQEEENDNIEQEKNYAGSDPGAHGTGKKNLH